MNHPKGATDYLRFAYQLYPDEVMEVFTMRNEFPPIEENIRGFISDYGADRILDAMQPDEIAQTISEDKKIILARVLLEQLFGAERAETILRDNGTT